MARRLDAASHHVPGRAGSGRRRRSSRDPLQSPMLEAFTTWPSAIPAADRAESDRAGNGRVPAVGGARVQEAARLLVTTSTSRHAARRSASSALPNGAAMYGYNVRWHTTTAKTPKRDSRNRPGGGEADPCRDGRRHGRVWLQGQLRRVQAVPAHEPAVLLHGCRVAADARIATSPSAPIPSWRTCSAACRRRRTA